MDLYKRYNVKPFASFLVLFVQLPIFIAVFSAIRVIATPLPTDNLSNRAYDIVAYDGSEIKALKDKQQTYLEQISQMSAEDKKNLTKEQSKELYDFDPKLFNTIDLTAKASDVISPNNFSWSALFMLVISIAAALAQYFVAKQTASSGKSEKKKKFREILQEAKAGKEVEDSEISGLATGQMSKMMPIMMFIIMFNLHGALAFYYFLSNIMTILQQKIAFRKVRDEMDDNTDKAILRELKKSEKGQNIAKGAKKIQEAEVVENKKTGTKITRISAKDNKKKRR